MKVWGVRYILIYRCSLYKFLVLLWIKIINSEEKGGGAISTSYGSINNEYDILL